MTDLSAIYARSARTGLRNGPRTTESPTTFGGYAKDFALAIPRGIEGFAQDAYGLADTLTGDALPDYKTRFLGESQTVAGSVLEGVANFATGFIPAAGALGKVGKVGKILDVTNEAEKLARAAGATKKALAISFGRNTLAGIATDFTGYGGKELKLSNIVQDVPLLANPLTEYLAADENDSEIEGRFKAAVEGAFLGAITEPLLGLTTKAFRLGAAKTRVALRDSSEAAAEKLRNIEQEFELEQGGLSPDTFDELQASAAGLAQPRQVDVLSGGVQSRVQAGQIEEDSALARALRNRETRGHVNPETTAFLTNFTNRVGKNLFNTLGLARRGAPGFEGAYDASKEIVILANRVLESGDTSTLAHELWHHLSKFVPPSYAKAVNREFKAAKAAWEATPKSLQKLKPKGYDYRFTDVDEWFAEEMKDRTFHRLARLDGIRPGVRGLMSLTALTVSDFFVAAKSTFGIEKTQHLLNKFLDGKYATAPRWRASMLDSAKGIAYSLRPVSDDPFKPFKDLGANDPSVRSVVEFLGIENGATFDSPAMLDEVVRRKAADIDPNMNPRAKNKAGVYIHSSSDLLANMLERNSLNLKPLALDSDPATLVRFLESMGDSLRPKEAVSNEQVIEEAAKLANLLGDDPQAMAEKALNLARESEKDLSSVRGRLVLVSSYVKASSEALAKELRQAINGNVTDPKVLLDLNLKGERLVSVISALSGLKSESGRLLQSNQIRLDFLSASEIDEGVTILGGPEGIRDMMQKLLTAFEGSGVAGLNKALRAAKATNVERGIELWLNSVLSGSKTAVVQVMSGALLTFFNRFELAVGGGFGALSTGDRSALRDSLQEIYSIGYGFGESLRASVSSFQGGAGLLTPHRGEASKARTYAWSADGRGITDAAQRASADALARKLNIPLRLFGGGEEFVRQLNFRMTAHARLVRQVTDSNLDAVAGAKFISDQMDRLIYKGQALSKQQLYNRGADMAREAGITSLPAVHDQAIGYMQRQLADPNVSSLLHLSEDGIRSADDVALTNPASSLPGAPLHERITSTVNLARQRHPLLRLFLPFVTTPSNVLAWSGRRMLTDPISALANVALSPVLPGVKKLQTRYMLDFASKDPRRIAEARGRIATGLGVYAALAPLAFDGKITGKGPQDKDQKDALMATGWRPYSVKIGDAYVSLQRLDPFVSSIGLVADLADYARYEAEGDSGTSELAVAAVFAFAENFTEKSYLVGLNSLLKAATNPIEEGPRFLERLGGPLVPSFLGQLTGAAGADHVNEINGYLETLINRTPFLSQTLDAKYDFLGKPLPKDLGLGTKQLGSWFDAFQPVVYSNVTDEPIRKELASLKYGFSAPRPVAGGLDLRDFSNDSGRTAYGRWQELTGTATLQGKTLQQALGKLINTQSYKKLSPESLPGVESPRIRELTSVVSRYRRKAYSQMLREFPELAGVENTRSTQKVLARLGLQ